MSVATTAHADTVVTIDCSVPDLIAGVNQVKAAGGGTINLAPGCAYTFTAPDNDGDGGNALPALAEVPGAVTINGNGAILQRSAADGTPAFRILQLGPGNANVTINNVTIANGLANGENALFDATFKTEFGANATVGGGIEDLLRGALTLDHVTVKNNQSALMGGGMVVAATGAQPLAITDSAFLDNTTNGFLTGGGGAIEYWSTPEADMTGTDFIGNTARFGGAVAISAAKTSFTNDTITQNHATQGGAAIIACCSTVYNPPLTNVTITGNTSPGATALQDYAFAYARNSIIDGTCDLVGGGGPYSLGYNVMPNPGCTPQPVRASNCAPPTGCGPDVTGVSAQLGPLADNGGPNPTLAVGPASPAYHLVPADACLPVDQRGAMRPQPGASACNAGAYETQSVPTTVTYTGPTSGAYRSRATLSAILSHPAATIGLTGTAVAGQKVSFSAGTQSCTATTDNTGAASCTVTLTDPPSVSPYPLVVSFTGGQTGVGSDIYAPTTDNGTAFTVTRIPTTLVALPQMAAPPRGSSAGLFHVATLLSGGSAPLAGRTIVFTIGTTQLCSAVSTATGLAKCAINARAQTKIALARRYSARFDGDDTYLGSTASAPMVG